MDISHLLSFKCYLDNMNIENENLYFLILILLTQMKESNITVAHKTIYFYLWLKKFISTEIYIILPVGASLSSQNWDSNTCLLVKSIRGIFVLKKYRIAEIFLSRQMTINGIWKHNTIQVPEHSYNSNNWK